MNALTSIGLAGLCGALLATTIACGGATPGTSAEAESACASGAAGTLAYDHAADRLQACTLDAQSGEAAWTPIETSDGPLRDAVVRDPSAWRLESSPEDIARAAVSGSGGSGVPYGCPPKPTCTTLDNGLDGSCRYLCKVVGLF